MSSFSTLASLALSSVLLLPGALAAPHFASPYHLGSSFSKRQGTNARCTYYYTDVGLGACGQLHQNNEWTVAMNTPQFQGGSVCGQTITITYQGKTASALVADECPTCSYGQLDLSPGLFNYFADESAGEIYASWVYGSASEMIQPKPSPTPSPTPTTTYTPPPKTTSTSTYVEPTTSSYIPPPPTSTSSSYTPPDPTSTSSYIGPSFTSSFFIESSTFLSISYSTIESSASQTDSVVPTSTAASESSAAPEATASVSVNAPPTQAEIVAWGNLNIVLGLVDALGAIVCAGNAECQ